MVKIVLVLEIRVAGGAHEVGLNLMRTPQSPTFIAPRIFDVALAVLAIAVCLLQVIIKTGMAREIRLTVRADIVSS